MQCSKHPNLQVESGAGSTASAGLIRGPYLARVDLAWRRLRLGLGQPAALALEMLAYFQRFPGKAVVPTDLQPYCQSVVDDNDACAWLVDGLRQEAARAAPSVRTHAAQYVARQAEVYDLKTGPG